MKKIGLKLKKTAVSLALMAAIAVMAGMIGRLLVFGRDDRGDGCRLGRLDPQPQLRG